jgi:hypothetical protein
MGKEFNRDSKVSMADKSISLHYLNVVVVCGSNRLNHDIEKIRDFADVLKPHIFV